MSVLDYNPAEGGHYSVDGEPVSLGEFEHAKRAQNLRLTFGSAEKLAEFLHQNYRAAAKSFKVPGPKHHDHGWIDCYGRTKRYFLRRAEWLLSARPHFNGRTR